MSLLSKFMYASFAGIGCVHLYGAWTSDSFQDYPSNQHPIGSVYSLHGKEVKAIGYTGHAESTIQNIDYNRALWITPEWNEAAKYAKRYGEQGRVAEVVKDAKDTTLSLRPFAPLARGFAPPHFCITPKNIKQAQVTVVSETAVSVR